MEMNWNQPKFEIGEVVKVGYTFGVVQKVKFMESTRSIDYDVISEDGDVFWFKEEALQKVSKEDTDSFLKIMNKEGGTIFGYMATGAFGRLSKAAK